MSLFDGFNKRYHMELQEEVAVLSETILTGNIADFTEYKKLVGKRQAFVQALTRHQELLALMDKANDN
jgi:hypothetical protein